MILDAELEFSDAQAVTAAAASTNIIDLGVARDIGVGEELYIRVGVETTMTDTGSDSTLAVTLETDDNAAFASAATVATLVTIPAVSVAGTEYYIRVPIGTTVAVERYIRLLYTPANGNLSAGAFDAHIVKDIQKYTDYASGFSVT